MSCGGWIERAHTIKISSVSVLPCRNLDSAGGRSRWAWNEGNTGCRLDAKPARTGRTGRISRVRGECLVDRMFGGSTGRCENAGIPPCVRASGCEQVKGLIINYIFYKNRRIYFYKINSCGTDDCFVSSLLRSDCIVWRARNVASGSNRFVLPMTGPETDRHGRPLPDSHRKGGCSDSDRRK